MRKYLFALVALALLAALLGAGQPVLTLLRADARPAASLAPAAQLRPECSQPETLADEPDDVARCFLEAAYLNENDAAMRLLVPDLRQELTAGSYSFAALLGSEGAGAMPRLIETTVDANRAAHVLALFAVADELRYRELVLQRVGGEGWRISAFTPLLVEEHPLVADVVYAPDSASYGKNLTQQILNHRRAWREPSPERSLTELNSTLARFDYQLAVQNRPEVDKLFYDLYRGGTLLQADLATLGPLALSDTGDDMAMTVQVFNGPAFLLRRGFVQPWDLGRHAFVPPVFLGYKLLSVTTDDGGRAFTVQSGGDVVYRFSLPTARRDTPIQGLWAWDGHWVLEVDGEVVVDGKNLNQQRGYAEIFGWRLLNGQPFFFFKQNEQIGISYAGQILPYRYNDVVHNARDASSAFNAQGNTNMVWFHGLRNGMWHYVEMGLYR